MNNLSVQIETGMYPILSIQVLNLFALEVTIQVRCTKNINLLLHKTENVDFKWDSIMEKVERSKWCLRSNMRYNQEFA